MTDREDLVPQCISICKVPKDIPYEILLSKLKKRFVKGSVKANTELQGLEDDTKLCRVILLLNDKAVVNKLLQVNEERIEHDGRFYTLFYSESMEYEIPEKWLNLPEEGVKPLPQARQASSRQYYDDQSGPVSGFYVNYDPNNMNPNSDQGQHVGKDGDYQHQAQPGNLQGHQGSFLNSQLFGYAVQPYGMQNQRRGQGSESRQDEGQLPRPGHMPHIPGGYYGPSFGHHYPYQPHPTQTGDDGDPNVQGQGQQNMQGLIPYGMPPQYYCDEQGRPINFPMGMPMSIPNPSDQSQTAVDKVMQHRPIKMLGVAVDVEMYIPKPDEPLCTIVVEGPASLMYEEMLELHFENKRKSGGDTIVDIQIDENHAAYITYESEEVAQRVVDKGKHKMANKELCVRLHVPEKKIKTKRQMSQASTDRDSDLETLEHGRTIEVRGPAAVLNEEILELYFENKKSDGGHTEKIDVYEDVAYITFETQEVAERVASKKGHKIHKLAVTVELCNLQEEEEQEPSRNIKKAGTRHKVRNISDVEHQINEVSGKKWANLSAMKVTDSDEIWEQFCDPCKDENNEVIAEGYCIDCSEYLCDGCYAQHKRPRPFRNHVLQGKTEMPKAKPAVKNTTDPSICDKHGEEIKFYCNSHAQSGCGACATFEHKLCDKVLYLEKEYKEIQKKCDEIGQSLDKNTQTKDQNINCIDDQFSNSSMEIANFRKEINDFFDKLESVKNSQAIEIKAKDRISMDNISIEFGQIKDELKALQHGLKDLYKSKQNVGLFSAMYEANGKLQQLSNKLNKLSQNNKIRKCQFIPEKKIKDMMKEVGEIGKLYF